MKLEYFFTYLIQNKIDVIKKALNGELPGEIVRAMTVCSLLCFAVFGFMIGTSHSVLQGAASFVKLPFIFSITSIITLPTLYIFLSLFGFKTSLKGIVQFCLISVSIMAIILLAFAPISLFFLVTGTPYEVYKLINVGILATAGISGIYIFDKYLMINAPQEIANQKRIKIFIRLWQLMFGLIGANLGFAISPIFGDPSVPFMWFSNADQNFFSHLIYILFS